MWGQESEPKEGSLDRPLTEKAEHLDSGHHFRL
jgi:hypothetical protein